MVRITNILIGAVIVGLGSIVGYGLAMAWVYKSTPESLRLNQMGYTTYQEVTIEPCMEGLEFDYPCPTKLKVNLNHGLQLNDEPAEDSATPTETLQPVDRRQQPTQHGEHLQTARANLQGSGTR